MNLRVGTNNTLSIERFEIRADFSRLLNFSGQPEKNVYS